jgi:hypothetical protein
MLSSGTSVFIAYGTYVITMKSVSVAQRLFSSRATPVGFALVLQWQIIFPEYLVALPIVTPQSLYSLIHHWELVQ